MADFTDDVLLSAGEQINTIVKFPVHVTNGEQITVSGSQVTAPTFSSDETVSHGEQISTYDYNVVVSGDVLSTNGDSNDIWFGESINIDQGNQIVTDEYRPQTQFILSGKKVEQVDTNEFKMYALLSENFVRVSVQPPAGEPGQNSSVVVVYDDDTDPDNNVIAHPNSGHPYFDIIPQRLGKTRLRVSGGEDNVHAWLDVTVVDEYPDTVLVQNGVQIDLGTPEIHVTNPAILNNNVNHVKVDGYVVLGTGNDILVKNGSNTAAIQIHNLVVSHGEQIAMSGGKSYTMPEVLTNQGGRVNVTGHVELGAPDDLLVSNGSRTEIVAGHNIAVSAGSRVSDYGWKEEPNTVVVVGGGNISVSVGSIEVTVPQVKNSTGAQTHLVGQKPEDILVKHRPVVALFRGKQVERGNIGISTGATLILTGVANGGTMPDVSVPCQVFYGSLVPGKCFVKGQIEEIPEISLDSSIRLGVKLYSCDNTLLNPTSFTSAYFTFDDELQLPANIDPVSSIIYVVARPADLSVLKRKKIYDMRLHAVDKQGNPSILLTRKLRFV